MIWFLFFLLLIMFLIIFRRVYNNLDTKVVYIFLMMCLVEFAGKIVTYTYACGNIINNNDERTHFFRKTYLSHFIWKDCERVVCERWIGDWTDCNILTPSSSGHSSTSSFCWAAQPESWEPKPSVSSWFSLPQTATRTPTNCLQLTQAVSGTRLYNCLTPTCVLWAPQLHRIQLVKVIPWCLRPDASVSWLTAGSKVNMLQNDMFNRLQLEKLLLESFVLLYCSSILKTFMVELV